MENEIYENNHLCRGCLCASTNSQSIYSTAECFDLDNILNLKSMFEECTSIKIEINDGLPDNLCIECIEELTASYNFRKKCQNSDSELKTLKYEETNQDEDIFIEEPVKLPENTIDLDTNVVKHETLDIILYPCGRCFKHFLSNLDLVDHIKIHPDYDTTDACCYCSESKLSNMKDLMEHIQTQHSDIHLIDCGYCDFNCEEEDYLIDHMIDTHSDYNQTAEQDQSNRKNSTDVYTEELQNEPDINYLYSMKSIEELDGNDNNENEVDEIEQQLIELETGNISNIVFEKDTKNNQEKESQKKMNDCPECHIKFKDSDLLNKHIATMHSNKPFKCHVKKCKQCSFKSKDELELHDLVYHIQPTNGVHAQCMFCKKEFTSFRSLRNHIKTHSNVKPFKCKFCTKAFNFQHHLNNHEKIHENVKSFSCKQCNKKFLTKDRLYLHKRIHSKERPFKCDICLKGFLTNTSVKIHQAVHTKEKPFLCPFCGLSFKIDIFLQNHMKKDHINNKTGEHSKKKEKPSPSKENFCKICNLCIENDSEYRQHIRNHGYKYPCPLCDKNFALAGNLTTHLKSQHQSKPKHQCEVCKARFHRPDVLRYHFLRQHYKGKLPHQCDICEKSFVQKSDLTVHKRRHAGERPFECNSCGKKFYTSSELTQHKRCHTGEKPYVCRICQACFISSNLLYYHMAKHNKNEIDNSEIINQGVDNNDAIEEEQIMDILEDNIDIDVEMS